MSSDRPAARIRENATEVATIAVTGIWLALLFAPVPSGWWLAALLFGYVVVVPLVALLFGDEEERATWWDQWGWGEERDAEAEADREARNPSTRDALEMLRERYARGELTDEQFESKLERLLDTETVESAEEWARRREPVRTERSRERE